MINLRLKIKLQVISARKRGDLFDEKRSVVDWSEAGVAVQVRTGEAGGVVEAVGEPPASVPARGAVRVGRHVEVEVECGEERVVEVEQRSVVGQPVELAFNQQLIVVELVVHLEALVAILCMVHYGNELARLFSCQFVHRF